MDDKMQKVLELSLEENDRLIGVVLKEAKLRDELREALQARRNMNADIFKELRR